MSIVINDFEVITEPPAKPASDTEAPAQATRPALKPADTYGLLRRHCERLARTAAH